MSNAEQWGDIVRRLYFKDGINPYLEEIDDVLKDHHDRIYKRSDIFEINSKKLCDEIKKVLTGFVYLNK